MLLLSLGGPQSGWGAMMRTPARSKDSWRRTEGGPKSHACANETLAGPARYPPPTTTITSREKTAATEP